MMRGDLGAGAIDDHGETESNEADRHQGKKGSSQMAEPAQTGDGEEDGERQRDPISGGRRQIGDQRRGGGRHADRDRQDEVDDQGADRNECPPLAKGAPGRRCGTATLREAGDQLVVIGDDKSDQRHHECHRRQEQGEVSVERAQGRLDRIRH